MLVIKKQVLKKQEKMKYIKENVDKSSAVIFYNFSRIDSNEIFLIKKMLKRLNSKWFVCKNTLFKKALSYKNLQINNNNAFIFCKDDQYEPLKILKNFNFRNDLNRRIQGGIYDGNLVDHQTLEIWSSLKSKKELLNDFCSFLLFGIFNLTMFLDVIISKKEK